MHEDVGRLINQCHVSLSLLQCNKIGSAIDTCVSLNQWHQAVELATKYNQPNQASTC